MKAGRVSFLFVPLWQAAHPVSRLTVTILIVTEGVLSPNRFPARRAPAYTRVGLPRSVVRVDCGAPVWLDGASLRREHGLAEMVSRGARGRFV